MGKKLIMITLAAVLIFGMSGTSMGLICLEFDGWGYRQIYAFKNFGYGFYSLNGQSDIGPASLLTYTGTLIADGGIAYIGVIGTEPGGDGNMIHADTYVIDLSTDTGRGNYQTLVTTAGVMSGVGYLNNPVTLTRGCTDTDAEAIFKP